MESGAGYGIDVKGTEALDQPAGDLLYALPQIAIGIANEFGIAGRYLCPDPRHLGVTQPYSKIIGLGDRHEGAAYAEFFLDAGRRRVILRVEEPVQCLAGRFDIVRV